MIATLLAFAATALGSGGQPSNISGLIPPALGAVSRLVWISGPDDRQAGGCAINTPTSWTCVDLPPAAQGVVALIANDRVAAIGVGLGDGLQTISTWGRVIRVGAGGVAPEDLRHLRLTAWKPDRSGVRMRTQRFAAVKDERVQILQLSDTVFWVAGDEVDRDGFLSLDGPAIGSSRIAIARLAEGAPEQPIFIDAPAPRTVTGRVQGRRGEEARGSEIELLEPLVTSESTPEHLDNTTPIVRRAVAVAGPDGRFEFANLSGDPVRIVASHPTLGRGSAWITGIGTPLVLELTPNPQMRGRVVRNGLPVVAARVRFIPDASAWATSVDPHDLMAAETTTALDGTFSLMLPAQQAGTVQILVDNGPTTRITLAQTTGRDIDLGTITVADLRRATIRLLDPAACEIVAVGPLEMLGLAIARAASRTHVYSLEVPEAGTWALGAECDGRSYAVDPPVIVISPTGPEPTVDVVLVKSDDDS